MNRFLFSFVLSVFLFFLECWSFADGDHSPALTAQTSAAGGLPQQPSAWVTLMPFALMFGVMYFLVIRPQQKKMKEQQNMLTALKPGDEVVTSSGILGTLDTISEKVVTLRVSKDVTLRVLKNQISQVLKDTTVKDFT